jgi:hypothetical protein
MHGSYSSSLSLQDVTVDDEQSALDNTSRPSSPFDILTPQGMNFLFSFVGSFFTLPPKFFAVTVFAPCLQMFSLLKWQGLGSWTSLLIIL